MDMQTACLSGVVEEHHRPFQDTEGRRGVLHQKTRGDVADGGQRQQQQTFSDRTAVEVDAEVLHPWSNASAAVWGVEVDASTPSL